MRSTKPYPDSRSLYQWADFYLARGWLLFPLHSVEHGRCTCARGSRCENAGKHPRNSNGFHGATTNLRTVRLWIATYPQTNLGVATGGPTHVVVIDIDPRHGGDRTLADLEDQYGTLPPTFTVRTGGGGIHLYFSMEGVHPPIRNSAGLLGPGVDVRGVGGYVVAPPSTTLLGTYWVEIAANVSPMPEWVVGLLRYPRSASRRSLRGLATHPGGRTPATREPPQSLDEAVLQMVTATEGTRNDTLNALGYWAGRMIAQGSLDEGEVVDRLTFAAALSGLGDNEIERTLSSGLDAGMERG